MKTFIFALAAAGLAIAGSANAASTSAAKGKERLDKMLAGRVAGKPESCIYAQIGTRLHVIPGNAIVYDAGGTIWVAKPDDPRSLDRDDILIINRFGSQLCKQDIIRTVDRYSGFNTGVVFLGDFVPYKKG